MNDITELAHHGPGSVAVLTAIEWRLAVAMLVFIPLMTWFAVSRRGAFVSQGSREDCRRERTAGEPSTPPTAIWRCIRGTVRDNILYGRVDAWEEKLIEAAKRGNIHELIMGLTEGYETDIGEKGIRLSGGRRQRVAIARAFLKDPPILRWGAAGSTGRCTTRSSRDTCRTR